MLRASLAAPGCSFSCFRDLSSLFAVGDTVPPLVSYVVFCVFVTFLYDILSEDCLSEQSASVSGLRQCTFLSSCLSEALRLSVVCGSSPFPASPIYENTHMEDYVDLFFAVTCLTFSGFGRTRYFEFVDFLVPSMFKCQLTGLTS